MDDAAAAARVRVAGEAATASAAWARARVRGVEGTSAADKAGEGGTESPPPRAPRRRVAGPEVEAAEAPDGGAEGASDAASSPAVAALERERREGVAGAEGASAEVVLAADAARRGRLLMVFQLCACVGTVSIAKRAAAAMEKTAAGKSRMQRRDAAKRGHSE
jgi:hypothetical protein